MQKKTKTYVVWKGRKAGIFASWEECARQVQGYPGARYRAYASRAAAEKAFRLGPDDKTSRSVEKKEWLLAPGVPVGESLAVDAACSGSPGRMEFRGVSLPGGRQVFRQGPFREATNNIGEFLAIVHGMRYLKENALNLPVYSDSATAIGWVKAGRCRTHLAKSRANKPVFTLISEAEGWLAQNGLPFRLLKWDTQAWGENPADFDRK
jgi:ribonuclease HI